VRGTTIRGLLLLLLLLLLFLFLLFPPFQQAAGGLGALPGRPQLPDDRILKERRQIDLVVAFAVGSERRRRRRRR